MRAGDGQALTLAAGQLDAVLADHGVQAIGQGFDEFQRMRCLGRGADFVQTVASRLPP
jgi:hypothetical protein